MEAHKYKKIGATIIFNIGDDVVCAGVADVTPAGSQRLVKEERPWCIGGLNGKPVAREDPRLYPRVDGQIVSGSKLQELNSFAKAHGDRVSTCSYHAAQEN